MPKRACFKYFSGKIVVLICIYLRDFVLLGSHCLFQLEHVLLDVGEKHLEKNNDLGSKVEVEVRFCPHSKKAQTTCAFSFETLTVYHHL
jgi:hypothetical protein